LFIQNYKLADNNQQKPCQTVWVDKFSFETVKVCNAIAYQIWTLKEVENYFKVTVLSPQVGRICK